MLLPLLVEWHHAGMSARVSPPESVTTVYTLVSGEDWRAAEAVGEYRGSAHDQRDGFLHFSTAARVRASAARHRAGEPNLFLVEEHRRIGAVLRVVGW
jgi:uncharacterized protein (DUF952 family)